MKKNIKHIFIASVIAILIGNTAFARTGDPNPQVNLEMTKAQITLFKSAVDALGPATSLKAANLWAEGVKKRNGAYQYAAASKELKKKIEKDLGKAEDNLWVTGASSPWLNSYKIISNTKVNSGKYTIKVKYEWLTSNGPEKPTYETLSVVKQGDGWFVVAVK